MLGDVGEAALEVGAPHGGEQGEVVGAGEVVVRGDVGVVLLDEDDLAAHGLFLQPARKFIEAHEGETVVAFHLVLLGLVLVRVDAIPDRDLKRILA